MTNERRQGSTDLPRARAAFDRHRAQGAKAAWPRALCRAALLLAVGLALACAPEVRGARCIRVIDGDSLMLRIDREAVECRLEGIDAPERSQPFGRAAGRHLASLVMGQPLEAEITGRDGFGRALVRLRRGDLDVNLEMVRQGYAWHFTDYSSDRDLALAQADARASRRGLWQDRAPVPPWEYRRSTRQPERRPASNQRRTRPAPGAAKNHASSRSQTNRNGASLRRGRNAVGATGEKKRTS